jgi:hypothetical protein
MAEPVLAEDMCVHHKKKLDIICITCRMRICSSCALFGVNGVKIHKMCEHREEQDVFGEI